MPVNIPSFEDPAAPKNGGAKSRDRRLSGVLGDRPGSVAPANRRLPRDHAWTNRAKAPKMPCPKRRCGAVAPQQSVPPTRHGCATATRRCPTLPKLRRRSWASMRCRWSRASAGRCRLLRQLISSPACNVTVFEDDWGAGQAIVSVAGGLFLADAVVDRYLAAPHAGFLSSVLASLLEGQRPLLTLEEIRRANSTDGLNLAVLSLPSGPVGFDDPRHAELRKAAPQAGVRCYGGYRMRAIYYEVFADPVANYLQAGGYRLLQRPLRRVKAPASSALAAGRGCSAAHPRRPATWRDEHGHADVRPAASPPRPHARRAARCAARPRRSVGPGDRRGARPVQRDGAPCWRSIYQRLALEIPQFDSMAPRARAA